MGVGFERGGQQLGFECWIRRKKETSLMFLSKLDSKDTEEYLFFRIEGSKCLGFWILISQVLMNLRVLLCLRKFGGFVPLVQRSSLKHVLEPLIYRQSGLKLLEGKQNNLNNLSKLLFVAYEGQWLYAVLVQEWSSVSGLLYGSFGVLLPVNQARAWQRM